MQKKCRSQTNAKSIAISNDNIITGGCALVCVFIVAR